MNRTINGLLARTTVLGIGRIAAYGLSRHGLPRLTRRSVAEESCPRACSSPSSKRMPTSIALANRYAYAQLLVTGVLADGSSDRRHAHGRGRRIPRVSCKLNDHRLVRPKADGETALQIPLAGQTISRAGQGHRA